MASPFPRRSAVVCSCVFFMFLLVPALVTAQTSSVSGTVTAGAGGPLSGVDVTVYTAGGQWAGGATTDASGHYAVSGLSDGTYYVKTSNSQGYVDEVWNNIPCSGCHAPSAGAGVAVAGAATADFTLDLGARFAGTVTNGSGPLANVHIQLYTTDNWYAGSGYTAANGTYLTNAVPPGSYRIRTWNDLGYIDEAYDNIVCAGCHVTTGDAVAAGPAGTITGGIDFALGPGGRFSGKVTDAGGSPISLVTVVLYNAAGEFSGTGYTQQDGTYITTAVPTGSYRLKTWNTQGYLDEAYDDVLCLNCPTTTGALVATSIGDITPNIDFALEVGGRIRATVTNPLGAPVANVHVEVYDTAGQWVFGSTTRDDGVMQDSTGLPAGQYYVRTWNELGYIDELFDNITCRFCDPVTTGSPVAVHLGLTTDVTFSLELGARLTGRVTGTGGVPLSGVSIDVYNTSGQNTGFGVMTGPDGTYAVLGLVSGSYVVRTHNNLGYLDQAYNGIECVGCPLTTGNVIVLASGEQRSNIDFALTAGGRIQGTVTGAGGAPLAGVNVSISDLAGLPVAGATTDASGMYQTTSLPAGTYFARTSSASGLGYEDQLYSGIPCAMGCTSTNGTPITVTAGATTTADFSLTQGGRIQGTVTGAGGAPIAGVWVQIHDNAGVVVRSYQTDATGTYEATGLAAGTYFAFTFNANTSGYFDELYDNLPRGCVPSPGCPVTSGTPITVTAGGSATANFVLTQGGRIQGTVTGAGSAPLQGVRVSIHDGLGAFVTSATTDASGAYLVPVLAAGSFRARTTNGSVVGYLDQLYSGLSCSPTCTVASGTPIVVVAGATATANFGLAQGATLTGTFSSSAGGAAAGVRMEVYASNGTWVTSGLANAAGAYSIGGIVPGNYYLRTSNAAGFIDRLYNTSIICFPSCTVTAGTLTAIGAGPNTIDMTLDPGARLSGRVVDNTTGAGISNVSIQVALSPSTTTVYVANTAADGSYLSGAGLPNGTYWVKTSNNAGYLDELHNNILCSPSCSISGGTGIALTAGVTTTLDFGLEKGLRFTGRVSGPTSAFVHVFNAAGASVTTASTVSGVYTTTGLAPGTYFLRTSNSQNFVDQLYNGIECAPCNSPTSGTPLTPAAGSTTTIDFTLTPGAQIKGKVSGPSGGVGGVTVEVNSLLGVFIRGTTTSSAAGAIGDYTLAGLPTGSYLVRTRNTLGLLDEAYDDIACVGCQIANVGATPVAVMAGEATSGIDFTLAQGGSIRGTVRDPLGNPLSGVVIFAMSLTATSSSVSSTTGTNGEYAIIGLATGTYAIRYFASSQNNFAPQYYNGVVCMGCSSSDATPISVTAPNLTAGIDLNMVYGGRISGTVTNGSTPVTGALVEITSTVGLTQATTSTASNGTYTSAALPVGTYFLRVRSGSTDPGYIGEVYDDVACVGCNPLTGTPLVVTADTVLTNINVTLARGSRISGTITDGVNPVASVGPQIYTATGALVSSSAVSGSDGTYVSRDGLLPGTYFARTPNTQGYLAQLYSALPCNTPCTPTGGTPITVTTGSDTTGVDFSLTAGGRISGTVADAATGLPIVGASVVVYDTAGATVTSASVTSGGTFLTGALATGTYRVITSNSLGYINQVFGGGNCIGCDPATSGTGVDVTVGATTSGIAFSLSRGGSIAGTVTGVGGAPRRSVTVEVWTAPYLRRVASATTDVLGQYTIAAGLPAGAYSVVTTNNMGYVNKIWDNMACVIVCDPASGAPVTVAGTATTGGIDFALDLDVDSDGDGINNTIDKNLGTGADEQAIASSDFTDVPVLGRTSGMISDRGGFAVTVLDLSAWGMRATAAGAGTSDVRLTVCAAGGAEEIRLRAANDSAVFTCTLATGTLAAGGTTVTATVAATVIELRKTTGGITTIVGLGAGQRATLGSPASADAINTEPIIVRILDAATGQELGVYTLDPGESAEATADARGNITITVVSGAVTAIVRGETVTIGEGASQVFEAPYVPPTPGAMHGEGVVRSGEDDYHFRFGVRAAGAGSGQDSFTLTINYGRREEADKKGKSKVQKRTDDRFRASSIDSVSFSDDPTINAGRSPKTLVDTVVFSGRGEWNGQAGYTFEVRAADEGEPGRHRESVSIVVRDASGRVVAQASGDLASGNVQSVRIKH